MDSRRQDRGSAREGAAVAAARTAAGPDRRGTAGPSAPRGRRPLQALVVALLLVHVPVASAGTHGATGGATAHPLAARSADGPAVARTAGPAAEGSVVAPATPATARDGRRPPVAGDPVRSFEAPAHDYGPGHRGVDLPAVPGTQVLAPAAGRVTFAGPVAGRGVVVLEHDGGTLTSLEPVEAVVPLGTTVTAGSAVAVVAAGPSHAGCPSGCLHWGVRVEGRYVDPWWWLGRTRPVRLLPWLQSPVDLPVTASSTATVPGAPAGRWLSGR